MSEAVLDLTDGSIPNPTPHEAKEPLYKPKKLLEINGDYYFKLLSFGVADSAAIDNQSIAQVSPLSRSLLSFSLSQKHFDAPLNAPPKICNSLQHLALLLCTSLQTYVISP